MEKLTWIVNSGKLPKSRWIDAPEYRLLISGDMQYDGPNGDSDVNRIGRYVDFVVKNDFEVVILGDSLNLGNSRERKTIFSGKTEVPGSEIFKAVSDYANQRFKELCDILEPLKGRTRLVLRGHHYFPFPDGEDSDYKLAKFLDADFGGDCALVTLKFKDGRRSLSTRLWFHHGSGSGQTPWAPMARTHKMTPHFPGVRLFAVGHFSKQTITQIPGITGEDDDKIFLVSAGAMMKGYNIGRTNELGIPEGSYVEKMMLPPAALGWPSVYFRPIYKKDRIDITAEET